MSEDRQRIDKWLWHARVVRTRVAAAALVASGHVRVNGVRVHAASRPVKTGDVLTIALDHRVRILRIENFAARRGGAQAAGCLYQDISPPQIDASSPTRDPGSGRPTKRERRAVDRWTLGGDT